MAIYSFEPFGYEGSLVTVKAELTTQYRGVTDIIGLPDSAIDSYKKRVRASVLDCGFDYPEGRVILNLFPADLRKSGDRYDLAGALAVLAEKDDFPRSQDTKVIAYGALTLDGTVVTSHGTTAALETAFAQGIKYAIIPASASIESIDGMVIIKVTNLREAYEKLCSLEEYEVYEAPPEEEGAVPIPKVNFPVSEVSSPVLKITFPEGHHLDDILYDSPEMSGMKWAMTLAAAGRLNMLAIGAPGCGKTVAMQCMDEITPNLTTDEKHSTERIYSLAGLNKPRTRPLRMPLQTASIEGMLGGGPECRPGEVSLAHNGALFLDEADEFKSSVLQMLRVPLENHTITLSRAGRSTTYPANFQLLMATNPCPCGNYGSKNKICLCSLRSISQYWAKFSAPLLDRVDIRYFFGQVNIPIPEGTDLTTKGIQAMVKKAWETQYKRQGKLNRDLNPDEVSALYSSGTTSDAVTLLDREGTRYGFGVRARASILKIARTMADIQGLEKITAPCIATAVALRKIAANGQPDL